MINGEGVRLHGWVMALLGDRTLVGKQVSHPKDIVLDPCCEIIYNNVPVQTPQGPGLMTQRQFRPVAGYGSWTSIALPPGTPTRPLSEFSKEEQGETANAVERLTKALRAKQANLIL